VPAQRGEELMARIGVEQVLAAALRYTEHGRAEAA
jgi:hypothetical protein